MNPGRLGLIGAPTYPMLRDATQAALLEILEANQIPYEHNKAENTLVMKDIRSRILFRPVEEFERLRGTNLALFGIDELTYTQEESWLRLEGRLRDPRASRLCGFAVWTPKGFDWVYKKFIAQEIPGYSVVKAPAYENRHLLEKVGNYYDQLAKSYDQKFYDQEVLGLYLNQSGGRAYSAFNRSDHLAASKADPRLPLLWALDFNVDPMSSLIAQLTPEKVTVLDEIVIRHGTTQEACEEFFRRFPKHAAGVVIYGDASGFHAQTTGASDYDMIREYFSIHSTTRVEYRVPRSNPSVKERLNLTNKTLRSASGEVGLVVDPKCKELINDFEQVCFKADTTVVDKDRDRMRTHLSDALGYLLWQEWRMEPAVGERREKLVLG